MGAGSANWRVVARPPGRVWAQTPVAVKRVASLTCLDIVFEREGGGRGWWVGQLAGAGCGGETKVGSGLQDAKQRLGGFERSAGSGVERR